MRRLWIVLSILLFVVFLGAAFWAACVAPDLAPALFLTTVDEIVPGHGRVVRQAPRLRPAIWHGDWTSFSAAGRIREQGRYDMVRGRVGVWTFYHENGQVARTGEFRDGMEVGEWWIYDERGTRIERLDYRYGVGYRYDILESTLRKLGPHVAPGYELSPGSATLPRSGTRSGEREQAWATRSEPRMTGEGTGTGRVRPVPVPVRGAA